MNTYKFSHYFIIWTFVILYAMTSIVSTIHVVDFFRMANPKWLAISLAVAFEIGAAASLASIITLDRMNKVIVWGLFIILTFMQAMGNTYYTFVHLTNFTGWIELFGLMDEDIIVQKRILAIVSGAILPVVALGFIKALVDYIKPSPEPIIEISQPPMPIIEPVIPPVISQPVTIQESVPEPITSDEIIDQPNTIEDIPTIIEDDTIISEVIDNLDNTVQLDTPKNEVATKVDNNIAGHMTVDEAVSRGLNYSENRITFTDKNS